MHSDLSKQILALLLLICLLFSLCACGAVTPPEKTGQTEQSAAQVKQTSAAPEKTTEQAEPAAASTAPSSSAPESSVSSGSEASPELTAPEGKAVDENFRQAYLALTARLFTVQAKETKSSRLISPLSILTALAMAANGAEGETLKEMEALLGQGSSMEELNAYLYSYIHTLPSTEKARFALADSIWINDQDGFTVEPDYLQKNTLLYDASVVKTPFGPAALQAINSWVAEHTDQMIEKILDQLEESTCMLLLNALVFDAEWAETFTEDQVREGDFTNRRGIKQTADFMYGSLRSYYLSDENTCGFIKLYKGSTYGFAALLPEEGTDFNTYLDSLDADKLSGLLASADESTTVYYSLPKFSYDCFWNMTESLKELGIPAAFDPGRADFSRISKNTPLHISDVLHKTHIEVGEMGTRAAAVTAVTFSNGGSFGEHREVYLDRPFVYMILDMENRLPIFIGAVTEIE